MGSDHPGCLVEKDQLSRAFTGLRRARVAVVDDDESCREAVQGLLCANDFDVQLFGSAEELLASSDWLGSDCLVVDATLPGASGPELQRQLGARNNSTPLIFVTGYDDLELRAGVMAAGAIDCLCKPYEEDELLACLEKALSARVVASQPVVPLCSP